MVVAIYEGVRVGGPTRYPPPMAVNRPQPNSKPVEHFIDMSTEALLASSEAVHAILQKRGECV